MLGLTGAVDRSGVGACGIVLGVTARISMLGFDFHIDVAFDASAIIDDEARGANIADDIASADDFDSFANGDISNDTASNIYVGGIDICFDDA